MLKTTAYIIFLIACFGTTLTAQGQFTFTGQLRTRTEIRNGSGNLTLKASKTAAFTSQRTRLNIGYKWDRLTFGVAIQDVRVWGQDASSISNIDGNRLMLHEGWADLVLSNSADTSFRFKLLDLISLKIGRQELNYDDVRLIGNLDWLQQARRHDMALLKTMHKGWQTDIGFAFNQNSDAFGVNGTSYLPANVPAYVRNSGGNLVATPAGMIPLSGAGNAANISAKTGMPVWINPPTTNGGTQDYKSFTSVYLSKKIKQTKFSALFFNDNFSKYKLDSVGTAAGGYVYGRRFVQSSAGDEFDYTGTHNRFTYGLMINTSTRKSPVLGQLSVQAAYYAQSGKNRDGIAMRNAYHYTVSASWQKGKLSVTPGYDVLSGNDVYTSQDEKFDPLYGTPHKHWGYMDYFYVGTGSPAGGLNNAYLKVKYTNKAVVLGADMHHFGLNRQMIKSIGGAIGNNLGSELDLMLNYTMNRFTNIEFGYSMMYATRNMVFAKAQAATDEAAAGFRMNGTWGYAMLKFTPDFLNLKNDKAHK